MATTFKVAHFKEQGQQVIAVLVSSSFGCKSSADQNEICGQLQSCARSAGLAGTVVPVWDAGGRRMGFLAPHQWQSFFRSISLAQIAASVNRNLTCG